MTDLSLQDQAGGAPFECSACSARIWRQTPSGICECGGGGTIIIARARTEFLEKELDALERRDIRTRIYKIFGSRKSQKRENNSHLQLVCG
ncbi:hypothetical protein COU17_00585 [Candidatus Kaiserbacteria bacterium CG10_big_fil_rev_8_21_14_0_10_49_17]|uniref:Uncharacterized protein n=1 Tax=Candidatus Kaiserbacteria bacterium CG10_big_fil_rev_8_21_14_0_10_49_17 TaxID=1974609 RepID=A0A2M6WF95_9BACT|nr:MAG: hypothetical protein COU17_00585 [Candidatus Kaiserbacteria bacterium CG10_big_fil_rev_8_21_14_0_10_49_17]